MRKFYVKALVIGFFSLFIGNQSYSASKLVLEQTSEYDTEISSLKTLDASTSSYYEELFNAINTDPEKMASVESSYMLDKEAAGKELFKFAKVTYQLSDSSKDKLKTLKDEMEESKKKSDKLGEIVDAEFKVKEELSKMILKASIDGTDTSDTVIGYIAKKVFKKDSSDDSMFDMTLSAFLEKEDIKNEIDKTQDELYSEGWIGIDPTSSYMVADDGNLVLTFWVASGTTALDYYNEKKKEYIDAQKAKK